MEPMPLCLSGKDADVVAFILREEVYKKDDPGLEGRAELIVAKQRNGPPPTFCFQYFEGSRGEWCTHTSIDC